VRKYLRIAFSAACGIICLLLIALWVRSYQRADVVHVRFPFGSAVAFGSVQGGMTTFRSGMPSGRFDGCCLLTSEVVGERVQNYWAEAPPYRNALGFGSIRRPGFRVYAAPYWFPVVVAALLGITPWMMRHWRFSLRTLLIATTLIAVGLGLIVAFAV
jgi:hypothetical protein